MIQASLCALHPHNRFVSFFTFSQSRVSGLQSVPLLADGRVRVALFAPHYPQLCGSGFYLFAATWRSAGNISSDFRVPQSTNFEALLLVGAHDLQTLSDCFDCSELLDYCKTRGT
jgi:hypothetical protein